MRQEGTKQRHFIFRFWGAFLVAALASVAVYVLHGMLRSPTADERNTEAMTLVTKDIEGGMEAFVRKDYPGAEKRFAAARDLALRKRQEEEARLRTEAQERKPVRKFDKPGASSVQPREYSFSLREAEARRYLAATRLTLLRQKQAPRPGKPGEPDAPLILPASETEKIREEIRLGMAANAQDRYLHPQLLHLLGQLEVMCGNPLKAVQALEEAVAIDPGFAEGYNDLGVAYASSSFMKSVDAAAYQQKAVAAFEKALLLSADGGMPDAHYNLGMYYAQVPEGKKVQEKDRQEAIRHLKAYVDSAPATDTSAAKAVLERLQSSGGKP